MLIRIFKGVPIINWKANLYRKAHSKEDIKISIHEGKRNKDEGVIKKVQSISNLKVYRIVPAKVLLFLNVASDNSMAVL